MKNGLLNGSLLHPVRLKTMMLIAVFVALIGTPIHSRASSGTPTLAYLPTLTHLPILQGSQASNFFTFKSGGSFQGNVTLSITGLPSGVTATWSKNPVVLSGGVGSSTLTVAASKTIAANWYRFTVTASGNGLSVSTVYTVEVKNPPGLQFKIWIPSLSMQSMGTKSFDIEAAPLGGVSVAAGAAARITSGLPSGITSSWSTPTLTASGGVMWTLTLTGSVNAVASVGELNMTVSVADAVTGKAYSAGQSLPLTIILVPPTLNISPALTHVPVKEGMNATDPFTFTSGGSFHGNVTLTVSGLPSGVTGSWSSSQVALISGTASSTLTLVASSNAIVNWFHFTVTATGDGMTVSNVYTVEVEPAVGVQVTLSSTALTIAPGATAALSVTASPRHGVIIPGGATGASVSVASALPSGVTASWSVPTVTSAGAVSWTLNLSAAAGVSPGSNPIQLAIQITDVTSGTAYATTASFELLVSLLADVSLGTSQGTAIPSTFMGLAHEWGDAQTIMGSTSTGVNNIYRQLLSNLTAYGSGPINIRVGGNSTDQPRTVTAGILTPFAELAVAKGSKFELGVDLGSNKVNLATQQVKSYMSQMPAGTIEAIEIGNEPDWYASNGLRLPTYTVLDYYSDFYTWKQNLLSVVPPGTKLMGASWAVTSTLPNIETFEADYANDIGLFSQHFYTTSPASNPAMDSLLTPSASTTGAEQVASAVVITHNFGMPFRIGELNSISQGGVQGISDTFSAALWSIDTMFEFANVGVDGVNWQCTSGAYYSAFHFTTSKASGQTSYMLSTAAPLYYGMLLFQAATGNGAQILPVELNTSANLKAWGTVDRTGTTRLVVINKDENASGIVSVNVPGYSHASIFRLVAPGYTSTKGVTLAGQTLDGSPDGTLQGTQTVEIIDGTNGIFKLPMSVMSAALVVFN